MSSMADSSRKPEAARRVRVRGRVQGVWFRASTAELAQSLSLRGHAENLPDGSVLVTAAGSAESLDRLVAWLSHGPPMARVESLEVEAIDPCSEDWAAAFLAR
jgi:acylphosphatase